MAFHWDLNKMANIAICLLRFLSLWDDRIFWRKKSAFSLLNILIMGLSIGGWLAASSTTLESRTLWLCSLSRGSYTTLPQMCYRTTFKYVLLSHLNILVQPHAILFNVWGVMSPTSHLYNMFCITIKRYYTSDTIHLILYIWSIHLILYIWYDTSENIQNYANTLAVWSVQCQQ